LLLRLGGDAPEPDLDRQHAQQDGALPDLVVGIRQAQVEQAAVVRPMLPAPPMSAVPPMMTVMIASRPRPPAT
jgi:hypothetical protein